MARGADKRWLHRAACHESLWRSHALDGLRRLARHAAVLHQLRKVSAVAPLSGDDARRGPAAACGIRGCARATCACHHHVWPGTVLLLRPASFPDPRARDPTGMAGVGDASWLSGGTPADKPPNYG